MPEQVYTRVEFTTDLGFGSFIVAFVDFSHQAISFGAPINVKIRHGTPDKQSAGPAISQYQRVSVHADGKVAIHLPTNPNPHDLGGLDQDKPPLAKWANPWCMRFEWSWAPQYLGPIKPWLAKPKPTTNATCRNVPVEFLAEATNTVVLICVVRPDMCLSDLSLMIPDYAQMWTLTHGWPWVLVNMSNVKCPGVDNHTNIGRNYK